MQIHVEGIRAHIQHMKDHAFIGKFVGIWPSEKSIPWWINVTWKPQGHYDLHLGAKGFFTVVFLNLNDRNIIFEGGPYYIQLFQTLSKTLERKVQSEERGSDLCPDLDQTLLPPLRILA